MSLDKGPKVEGATIPPCDGVSQCGEDEEPDPGEPTGAWEVPGVDPGDALITVSPLDGRLVVAVAPGVEAGEILRQIRQQQRNS